MRAALDFHIHLGNILADDTGAEEFDFDSLDLDNGLGDIDDLGDE